MQELNGFKHELEHFEKVVSKIGCTVIDVSNRAVEETANLILTEVANRNS